MAPPKPATKVLKVSYVHDGKRETVHVDVPDSGESEQVLKEDASKFVQTLADNHQLAYGSGPMPPGTTHVIETGPDGVKRVTRKRFSVVGGLKLGPPS